MRRRVIGWKDVQSKVAFDVVGFYAAVSAIGVGLDFNGGSLWPRDLLLMSCPNSWLRERGWCPGSGRYLATGAC
jgi:hypothetical protein